MRIVENGRLVEVNAERDGSRWTSFIGMAVGSVLYVSLKVGFERRGIEIGGVIPAITIVASGAFAFSCLLRRIERSNLDARWKKTWFWILPLSCLPLSFLMAFGIATFPR